MEEATVLKRERGRAKDLRDDVKLGNPVAALRRPGHKENQDEPAEGEDVSDQLRDGIRGRGSTLKGLR